MRAACRRPGCRSSGRDFAQDTNPSSPLPAPTRFGHGVGGGKFDGFVLVAPGRAAIVLSSGHLITEEDTDKLEEVPRRAQKQGGG